MISIEKDNLGGHGLHARPALQFVNTARKFQSDIQVTDLSNGKSGDAKAIMSVLALGASSGHHIRVTISGVDEALAGQAVQKLFEELFSE